MADRLRAGLFELARLFPVQLAYRNILTGRPARPANEALTAILRAVGAELEGPGDLPGAARARRLELWSRVVPPVIVAWRGRRTVFDLRLPGRGVPRRLSFEVAFEGGGRTTWREVVDDLPARGAESIDRARFVRREVRLPGELPPGYHHLTVTGHGPQRRALVIAAPQRVHEAATGDGDRAWGVFLPLYALETGAGSAGLTGLVDLALWARSLGGTLVGTLPLLGAFLEEPFEPSPYSPISRLFWNEFHLDPSALPEFAGSPDARRFPRPTAPGPDAGRGAPLVDYRAAMAARRRLLTVLLRRLLARPGGRDALLDQARRRPDLDAYACFRATCETRREPFRAWPARLRDGALRSGDFDPERRLYHLYAQWRTGEQIASTARAARDAGGGLYLDLPLGSHPDGYDAWRERRLFADDVNAGAPPDGFFTTGQDWGFRPIHPERSQEQGHRHQIEVVRRHLRHAALLRLDHVMGLHRLFWVPHGMQAADGVYVRYPAEEMYAILSLESHRARARVVGEDLGTVPPEVRRAMARHGLLRMYVLQSQARRVRRDRIPPAPRRSVAALNTHDMPTFAGYWRALDVTDRRALGVLDARGAAVERRVRATVRIRLARALERAGTIDARGAARAAAGTASGARAALAALLRHLGSGPAEVVIVNLEDLWGEIHQQNTPGTTFERANWRRKARYNLDTLRQDRRVLRLLAVLEQSRRRITPR